MKGIHQRILASLAVVVIFVTLGITAERYTSLEWLVTQEFRLRDHVRAHSVASWMAGFLIYICFSLIPGLSGKAVIVGWLFGFWTGVLMVDLALAIAAMVTFFASRYLLREAIEERFGIHLSHLKRKLESQAAFYLLSLRFLHTPFSFLNYAAGATNIVATRTFFWTTLVGMLPGTMVFVFAGTRIPALSVIAEKGIPALLDRSLIGALVAVALMPLIIRLTANRIRPRLSARHTDSDSRRNSRISGVSDVRR